MLLVGHKEGIQSVNAYANRLNAHCKGSKVVVPCKPSNQQCLRLRVGRDVGLQGSTTFDPAQHAVRCAAIHWPALSWN